MSWPLIAMALGAILIGVGALLGVYGLLAGAVGFVDREKSQLGQLLDYVIIFASAGGCVGIGRWMFRRGRSAT